MTGQRRPGGGQARHADDWLMTYADVITLLLCLFAVLPALHNAKLHHAVRAGAPASADAPAQPTVPQAAILVAPLRELAEMRRPLAYSDDDPDDPTTGPGGPPLRQALAPRGRSTAEPSPVRAFTTTPFAEPAAGPGAPLAGTAAAVAGVAGSPATDDHDRALGAQPVAARPVSVPAEAPPRPKGDRITMFQFSSAAFFASGSAALSPSGHLILESLLRRICSPAFAGYRITVEGHTDDEPIGNPLFPSNWELSAARAAAVVRFFVEHGIPAERLRAAGYADTRPLAPNRDMAGDPIAENQAKNRRVVIELEKIDREGT